jgi:hypothetical protein
LWVARSDSPSEDWREPFALEEHGEEVDGLLARDVLALHSHGQGLKKAAELRVLGDDLREGKGKKKGRKGRKKAKQNEQQQQQQRRRRRRRRRQPTALSSNTTHRDKMLLVHLWHHLNINDRVNELDHRLHHSARHAAAITALPALFPVAAATATAATAATRRIGIAVLYNCGSRCKLRADDREEEEQRE